jgi:carotenoid cleavage dioxygenase-like enzyme
MTTSAPTPTAPQPYLSGNYAPVSTETEVVALSCAAGAIPRDLEGMFVRNGSNPRFPPKGRYHWFDGDGMMHGVHFEGGRASYRNRWVRTEAFLAEEKAGEALWSGVTERPDFTNPRGPFKDSSNTDVVFHAGRLLSLWWLGGAAYALRVPDLETCGVETWGGKVKTVSAHPKVDAVTGEMMFFDYKPVPPYLVYGVVSKDGALAHLTTVDLPGPRLQHDMAITERFTILLDMSMMWDPKLLAQGRTKVGFFRDKPGRFGVLPRFGQGSEVRWFEAEPFYMYHTINAWEEGDTIVIVGCRIEHPLAGDPENPKHGPEAPTIGFLRLEPALHRWRLDLRTGKVSEERLDDALAEFPRMDNRLLGRKSRFSYHGSIAPAPTMLFDGVLKYDTDSGRSWAHRYPAGCFGGETVFAPRVGSKGEDDGYLLTFVADERSGAAELWVIDARDVEAAPVARLAVPQRVPTGYHTWWISAEQMGGPESPPKPPGDVERGR